MEFILGIIIGIIISVLIQSIVLFALVYFKDDVKMLSESIIPVNVSKFKNKKKGMVVQPETDIDEKRKQIIEENRKKGLDTPISDLL